MTDHAVLDPDDFPKIAVASMEATHHEEIELVNEIGQLILDGQAGELDEEALRARLEAWIEHTRAHFARENKLMEEYAFPASSVHSNEHHQSLAGLEAVCQAWREEGDLQPLADYVFHHWPEWFRRHVATMDTMTALFLSQRGVQ